MNNRLCTLLALTSLLSLSAAASGVGGFLQRMAARLDSMTVRGVDRRYIDAPREPWQIIARGNINQTDLKMKSTIDGGSMFQGVQGNIRWEPTIRTSPSTYAGFWAGYRGYGIGYSWNVGGDKGSILTFGATGGSYGINLRIHNFETDEPEVWYAGNFQDDASGQYRYESRSETTFTWNPIRTRTLLLDGYYLFNGKRFSYAAAYDQSVIQKRSAGSLMAGAMYYYAHTRYDSNEDADFILLMNDIGRIKQWQLSVGMGYAYNWVPVQGLLVNVMAMPMLTCLNRLKVWRFGSNYRDMALDSQMHIDDELNIDEYQIWPLGESSQNSHMTLNLDARLSITYQWSRYFVNAYGQFNRFSYSHSDTSGRLTDWYVNAAVGVRF